MKNNQGVMQNPTIWPYSTSGYWAGLAVLSCFSLGLLLGYGVAAWNKPSLLLGTPLTPVIVSPREPLSWRNVPTITKPGLEKSNENTDTITHANP
jgi:hypothetical protein